MAEEQKKSGLQKDVSSIFAGLEGAAAGRRTPSDQPALPRPEQVAGAGPPARPGVGYPPGKRAVPAPSAPLISRGAFPAKRNSFVGLDIGFSSIKLVQIYPNSGGWEIGGYAIQELGPPPAGKSTLEIENLARILKKVFAETGASRSGVICGLSGGEVVINLVQLARMPKNELEGACRLEAGRWADFNVEKAILQCVTVNRGDGRPGGKSNQIVVAASRDTVSRWLGLLRAAGLQAAALLPLPFAWKGYFESFLPNGETSSAVVDVGSTRTVVAIYKGSQLRFSREFEGGGRQITEAIFRAGEAFGVSDVFSWEEAEEIQRTVDLFSAGSGRQLKGGLTASQIGGMVRPVLEKIVQESKRAFDYYRQLYRQEEVGRVYLCGGGSLPPGLLDFFRELVPQPVEPFSLPEQVGIHDSIGSAEELKLIFPRLVRATAFSLSRRWEVNFVPPLDKILQNVLRHKLLVIIPVLLLFLINYLFYRSKADLIPIHRRLVEQQSGELVGLQAKLAPYQVLSDLQQRLAAGRQAGSASAARRPNWKGILKELSRITPANVIVTGIMTIPGEGPQRILCNGRVINSADAAPAGVTQFIVQVENSPFFQEVRKISEDIDRGTFSFSCTLIY